MPELFEERAAVTLSWPHNQCRPELRMQFLASFDLKLEEIFKDIQVEFFSVHQNVGINLKCIFTKFELYTFSSFQDITVLNHLSTYFSVGILSVL